MKIIQHLFLLILPAMLWIACGPAKVEQQANSDPYLNRNWKQVATDMPADWYGSDEAKLVAENVLISQRDIGGWEKNKSYHKLSESKKIKFIESKPKVGATFDNGATITELRFLARVYSQLKDERYKQAFEKGLNYIFISQYENGGWPQFFPFKEPNDEIHSDKTKPYSMHITYNDNAMVNIMRLLKDIYTNKVDFKPFQLSNETKTKAKTAFDKGIQCILKTQIIIDNTPTVWCAQHDEITLASTNARSYELASFSGSESVNIALLLMDIEHPSEEILEAVDGAMRWFETHKISGIKIESEVNILGKKNRIVVEEKNAPPIWARFYDLETGQPFFCSRDGIKKNSIAEISSERRNGYGWYTDAPAQLLEKYPEWRKKAEANQTKSAFTF